MSDTTTLYEFPKKGKWGINSLPQLLRNLRVAETGGDVAECADALEALLAGGRERTFRLIGKQNAGNVWVEVSDE